jgi:hypothetical protein
MNPAIEHLRAAGAEDNRIAIRLGASAPTNPDAPIRSADVYNNDRLTKRCPHPLSNDAPDHIRRAARRIRHDHSYLT